jgi:hypothetical protein
MAEADLDSRVRGLAFQFLGGYFLEVEQRALLVG